KPILLMSHLDVVRAERGTEGDWTYPPFSGTVADGFIWGRGALDVKCGVLGLMEAVERLLSDGFRPASDVYLAFGHDEEIGGREGNLRIAQELRRRGVRFRFVLDEGGGVTEGIIDGIAAPVAFVGIAEKGYATVDLHAIGPEGHSSMPPPHTAVGRLCSAIDRLEAHPSPSRIDGATAAMLDYLGPEMPWPRRVALANRWLAGGLIARQFSGKPSLNGLIRTTRAATVIRGGETPNVLPARASATVNVRLLPGESAETAFDRIRALLAGEGVSCQLRATLSEPSRVSSVDSDGFGVLHRTIAEVYPGSVVAPGLSMVATDSRHYAAIADDIYRFLPLRVTADDLERIHGTDERIAVDDYAALIGFLARLIQNASAPGASGVAGPSTTTGEAGR
ncbi:M20/M25/M40 family metallo-hydrolase, partial [Tautonia sp. JC769]|uniref:M20/M25/M40 family metallo-hydrolase n=1 Tax=Tautonia sp. JC769 TaxID=3232135 RepID=UPI0034582798